MEALTSILAFFVSMVCLMILFAWMGFRVLPYVENFFGAFSKCIAVVFPPLYRAVLFCGKLLFRLGVRLAENVIESGKQKTTNQPNAVKRHMVTIRKDRLCQFEL